MLEAIEEYLQEFCEDSINELLRIEREIYKEKEYDENTEYTFIS